MSTNISRRHLLGATGLVLAAAAPQRARAANDKIQMGWIGTGSRGYYLLERMYQTSKDNAVVTWTCDAYTGRLARGKDRVQTMGGNNNKAARSGGGGNRQAGSGGAGNRQGGGGGNRQAVGGGGNRNWSGNRGGGNRVGGGGGGRTAAGVAIGLGLVGGLIAAEQQRQAVEQEYVEEPVMMRCPYGSYINRYGERRCRR